MFIVTGRSIWAVLAAVGVILGMAFFAGSPFDVEPRLAPLAAAANTETAPSARLVLRDAGNRLRRTGFDAADDAAAREFELRHDAAEEIHHERVRTVAR